MGNLCNGTDGAEKSVEPVSIAAESPKDDKGAVKEQHVVNGVVIQSREDAVKKRSSDPNIDAIDDEEGTKAIRTNSATIRQRESVLEIANLQKEVEEATRNQTLEANMKKQRLSQRMQIPKEVTAAEDFFGFSKLKDAIIWKLNKDIGLDNKEEMSLLTSWRRRDVHLVMNPQKQKVACIYISEKYNVLPSLLVMLRSGKGADAAQIEALPEVVLKMDGKQDEFGEKNYEYDAAIDEIKNPKKHPEDYAKELPSRLYPLSITLIDDEESMGQFLRSQVPGEKRILGFPDLGARTEWMQAMKDLSA